MNTLEYGTAPNASSGQWLHRYAVLLAFCTLLLIAAGGMVTSTESGLAVPDWPTTYGENMFTYPYSKWVGGIFYEHGHRLIASTVGFLTIILAVWIQLREPRRWLRILGWLALLAVVLQGILGGLTVRYLLPTPISVFHACLAQVFLCIVVSIAVFTSPAWCSAEKRSVPSTGAPLTGLCALLTALVFGQLFLGAVMRHTESGLAVPDFPLAYKQVVPDLSDSALERYNHSRRWELQIPQTTREQIVWHLAHRAGAVVVTIALISVCGIMLRRHGDIVALRRQAIFAILLLAAQIGLGAWTVWSGKAPVVATSHVAVGAATLACCLVMTLRSWRLLIATPGSVMPVLAPAGVVR